METVEIEVEEETYYRLVEVANEMFGGDMDAFILYCIREYQKSLDEE